MKKRKGAKIVRVHRVSMNNGYKFPLKIIVILTDAKEFCVVWFLVMLSAIDW